MIAKRPMSSGAQPQSPGTEAQQRRPPTQGTALAEHDVPFYISPIHRPSCFPRFPHLAPASDFATWLTPRQAAKQKMVVEVWFEDSDGKWAILDGVGGEVDLRDLRRATSEHALHDNALLVSLAGDAKGIYYFPLDGSHPASSPSKPAWHGVVERSVRETRMKRGAGVGSLHQ
jgi:hypothetical protein